MVPMAELNRLFFGHTLAGGPRRPIQRSGKEEKRPNKADSSENEDARQDILAAMKDLHSFQAKPASAEHKIRHIVFFQITS